jgi:hypothetical protein
MTKGSSLTLECGHIFHTKCISQWGQQNETCPLCRKELGYEVLTTINKDYIDLLAYFIFSLQGHIRQQAIYNIEQVIMSYFEDQE